jgi:hypothetical protein
MLISPLDQISRGWPRISGAADQNLLLVEIVAFQFDWKLSTVLELEDCSRSHAVSLAGRPGVVDRPPAVRLRAVGCSRGTGCHAQNPLKLSSHGGAAESSAASVGYLSHIHGPGHGAVTVTQQKRNLVDALASQ